MEKNTYVLRAVRGAVQVQTNTVEKILESTIQLMNEIVSANRLEPKEIISAFFTTTQDLNAEYPAAALRKMGWGHIPALCAHEMNVPGGMPMVLRVLIHFTVKKKNGSVVHQYLGRTAELRPDLKGDLQ